MQQLSHERLEVYVKVSRTGARDRCTNRHKCNEERDRIGMILLSLSANIPILLDTDPRRLTSFVWG